jgi:hypothetical protein
MGLLTRRPMLANPSMYVAGGLTTGIRMSKIPNHGVKRTAMALNPCLARILKVDNGKISGIDFESNG